MALACGASVPSSSGAPPESPPVAYVGHEVVRGPTISKPALAEPGDLMVTAVLAAGEPRLPAGWTALGSPTRVGPDGFVHYFAAGWRVAQAGDASWSWGLGALTITHAYRYAANAPIQAYDLARSQLANPLLRELRASSSPGDAAVYICIGVYHANVHPAPGYTPRIDWTADDFGSGDRLGLAANATTGGRLDTAGDAWNDRGVLHLIVKAAVAPPAARATRPETPSPGTSRD
jgi:hypothetical protein